MKRLFLMLLLLLPPVWGQDVDTLLRMLKKEQSSRSAELHERETRFIAEKAEQQQRLKAARSALAALKEETKRLQKIFDDQETEIEVLSTRLQARAGDLGEIFGVVHQNAGELRGIVENSVVSAELPGREAFLAKMGTSTRLPSSDELRKLWLMQLEEIVASGKVATLSPGSSAPTAVMPMRR